jgi:hypothetical protein
MIKDKEKILSLSFLLLVFVAIIWFFIFLQFISPVLYEIDGYYHTAVSSFIKTLGPHFKFHWAQFSTFKDSYSDKDFLFHVSIIPFLYISDNLILGGKFTVIFYNILFFLAYIFILRKYLPDFLVACFLLLPILSSQFCAYSLWLRPAVLANIFTLLSIYFLINKNFFGIFIVSVLFPLSHISFYTVIIFAFACESIRYALNKDFCLRNIYFVALGNIIGCLIHPNFPHNLISFYLNGILVPFYSITQKGIIFGTEMLSSTAKFLFVNNFNIFITLNIVLLLLLLKRIKISFPTFAWWICTNFCLALSFFSDRYLYITNVLVFVFFASFLKDWKGQRDWNKVSVQFYSLVAIYAVAIILFFPSNINVLRKTIVRDSMLNAHYENVGRWMASNIAAGETIYHAYGSDSAYFICLNPKNNYINFQDPIYMFWRDPKIYAISLRLKNGEIKNPSEVLVKVFKSRYGYTRKILPLFEQIKKGTKNFKILYEDNFGAVFNVKGK